jgi:hypothetical protein
MACSICGGEGHNRSTCGRRHAEAEWSAAEQARQRLSDPRAQWEAARAREEAAVLSKRADRLAWILIAILLPLFVLGTMAIVLSPAGAKHETTPAESVEGRAVDPEAPDAADDAAASGRAPQKPRKLPPVKPRATPSSSTAPSATAAPSGDPPELKLRTE